MSNKIPVYRDHKKIVKEIAKELSLDPIKVYRTISRFFSNVSGIQSFIRRRESVTIRGFGTFKINALGHYLNDLIKAQERIKKMDAIKRHHGINKGDIGFLQGFPVEVAKKSWKESGTEKKLKKLKKNHK